MEYRSLTQLQTLSGTPVSVEPAGDSILSNDLFLIAQPCSLNVSSGNYFSENLSYAQLSAKIFEDIKNRFPFKDMAYVDKDEYSKIGHTHEQYNKVAIQPVDTTDMREKITLATITVGGQMLKIEMLRPIEKTLAEPSPGQLKFVALQKYEDANLVLSAFPGWVWADGSTYKKKDYALYDYFESVSDEDFAVPNINDMLQFNNTPYDEVNTEILDPANQTGRHGHTVNLRMSGKTNGSISYIRSNFGSGIGTHSAGEQPTGKVAFKSKIKFDAVSITGDASFSKCEDNGKQTLPIRIAVPVLVYIGKKNK